MLTILISHDHSDLQTVIDIYFDILRTLSSYVLLIVTVFLKCLLNIQTLFRLFNPNIIGPTLTTNSCDLVI